jgi:ADP-dependent NAD(P)H-hydrate dehydratase / NAD(P)H-hydrate epimerase
MQSGPDRSSQRARSAKAPRRQEKPGAAAAVPIRICTAAEMRELDRVADKEYGLDALMLMENAGKAAAELLLARFPRAGIDSEYLFFAGKGNNAGDAFVVARHLLCADRKVRVFHLEEEQLYKGACLRNFQILKKMRAKLVHLDNSNELQEFFASSPGPFSIVDGLLGTGLVRDLEGIFYEVVELINAQDAPEVISLDIPSGVSGDTGMIHGTAVHATLTISFGYPKLGHFLPPGAGRRGDLVNVDISLPPKFRREGDKFLLMKAPIGALIKERDRYGHKNAFGHALLIGGSPGRIGAITLSARACHKMGTGLVTVATWDDAFEAILYRIPAETMAVQFESFDPGSESLRKMLKTYSSMVVGPGLGLRAEGLQLLQEVLTRYEGPIVLDADALNLVADHKLQELIGKRRAPTVLTPHPGEMARLLGVPKGEVVADPVGAVKKAVADTHAIVLLKGAATLITSADEVLYLNHYPNDGMATAGSGDVLSGMIGGLLGQGMDPFQATLAGVYLHSLSGDFAAKERGHRSMTAGDIIENIGNAFKELKQSAPQAAPVESSTWLL